MLGYPDDLVEPIVKDKPGNQSIRPLAELFEDEGGLARGEWLHKLYVLLEHYNIKGETGDPFQELAINLVNDWVPGFQILERSPRPGAEKKNTDSRNDQLVKEIDRIIKRRKAEGRSKRDCGVMAACRERFESMPADKRRGRISAVATKNLYIKAKSSFDGRERFREKVSAIMGPPLFGPNGLNLSVFRQFCAAKSKSSRRSK